MLQFFCSFVSQLNEGIFIKVEAFRDFSLAVTTPDPFLLFGNNEEERSKEASEYGGARIPASRRTPTLSGTHRFVDFSQEPAQIQICASVQQPPANLQLHSRDPDYDVRIAPDSLGKASQYLPVTYSDR